MTPISRTDAKAAGLKRYFTGRPCRHGHIAERTICDYACVECGRLQARDPQARESRRDYMAAHQRRYRRDHPDRVRATKLKHGQDHLNAQRRARRAKDPSKDRAALRRSFQKHKTKRIAENRAWKSENPAAVSIYNRAAKAKRRAAKGGYTRQDIERLMIEQRSRCANCHRDISGGYHVDHIWPLSRGGTNWLDNLQLLCQPCNQSKGNKTMLEWLGWQIVMLLSVSATPSRTRRLQH